MGKCSRNKRKAKEKPASLWVRILFMAWDTDSDACNFLAAFPRRENWVSLCELTIKFDGPSLLLWPEISWTKLKM